MFFNYKLNNSKEKLELIQNINHPTAYWVLLKTVLYTKNNSELNKIEKNLIRYFEEESEGYSMPAKFPKQISSIRKKLFNDKESIDH